MNHKLLNTIQQNYNFMKFFMYFSCQWETYKSSNINDTQTTQKRKNCILYHQQQTAAENTAKNQTSPSHKQLPLIIKYLVCN